MFQLRFFRCRCVVGYYVRNVSVGILSSLFSVGDFVVAGAGIYAETDGRVGADVLQDTIGQVLQKITIGLNILFHV